MADWQGLFPKETAPAFDEIEKFIQSPLWPLLNREIQETYGAKPLLSYSGCSMQKGWNLKYRKSGKALCTLYPMSGYFIALVVIGAKEMDAAKKLLPDCSDYVRELFARTEEGMGQKWLMIHVREEEVIDDVMALIALRVPSK